MDNFYTSLQLSRDLLNKKIHSVGTCRKNRGTSESFESTLDSLKKNSAFTSLEDGIFMVGFNNRKRVRLLSSFKNEGFVEQEVVSIVNDKNKR